MRPSASIAAVFVVMPKLINRLIGLIRNSRVHSAAAIQEYVIPMDGDALTVPCACFRRDKMWHNVRDDFASAKEP
jgi:hypothetical protein